MTVRNPFTKRHKLVVVQHITIETAMEGLWDGRVRAGHYRIDGPTLISTKNVRSKLPGSVLIPKDNVAFLQVLAEDAA